MADSTRSLSRRALLRAAPAAVATGLAGCPGRGGDGGADTGTTTATPVSTPSLPNVEKRTVQRDRAAIVHVSTVHTGTISWPAYELVVPEGLRLVGVWEGEGERFTFERDDTFRLESPPEGTFRGTWDLQDGVLRLALESGGTLRYRATVEETTEGFRLTLSDGASTFTYRRTRSGFDSGDVLEVLERLELAPATGAAATTSRSDQRAASLGSGFIVTPDGHVVTNAHVVGADADPRRQLFVRLAADLNQGLEEGVAENFDVTDVKRAQIEDLLFDKLVGYMLEAAHIEDVETTHRVLNGRAGPDEDPAVESWDGRIKRAGRVMVEADGGRTWGRDVAVLKVDQTHLPTVSMGDAGAVETGDEVFVIGYPDIGVDSYFEARERTLAPTLTSGVVSARRRLTSGVETIQTDAGVNSGNSGGPVYDDQGEVVGIATFQPAEADIQQIEFALPITEATAMLAEVGVEPRSGDLDTAFDAGLEAYWRGDCETATERMRRVLELRADHPDAQGYIDDCEAGRAPGQSGG